MALVVLAEGQQRSGSIGGTVWSHNRFGAYIRARSIPVNPNTDRMVAVRNAVRSLTIGWENSLTQAQRNGWDVYGQNVIWQGSLGQAISLTGLNHYVRSNVPRIQIGVAQVDAPPGIFNVGDAEGSLTCTASAATQNASMGFDNTKAWASEDGAYQIFYGGLPKNASIKFFGGPYRLLHAAAGDSGTPPVSPSVQPWPFPFIEGNRLWIRSRISRADGRLSEFAIHNFLAAA